METESRDPIHNVIYGKHGIIPGIKLMYENEFFGQTLILIFAGIDSMSNLIRRESKPENDSLDFTTWIDRYMYIKGITSSDLWSARNAIMHTYGVRSRDTKSNRAKTIGWISDHPFPISSISGQADQPKIVIVSIKELMDKFIKGVEKFLIDVMSNKDKRALVEKRFEEVLHSYRYEA